VLCQVICHSPDEAGLIAVQQDGSPSETDCFSAQFG